MWQGNKGLDWDLKTPTLCLELLLSSLAINCPYEIYNRINLILKQKESSLIKLIPKKICVLYKLNCHKNKNHLW